MRREAVGMNRRNLAFLVPYNRRALFALADHKGTTKRVLAAAGIPVPPTYAELTMQWDIRRLGALVAPHRDFVLKPARGSGGGGVLVVVRHEHGRFVKPSGAVLSLADLAAHCSEILSGAFSVRQLSDAVLIGVIGLEVLLGKWRGLRLLEYVRFRDLVRSEKPVA